MACVLTVRTRTAVSRVAAASDLPFTATITLVRPEVSTHHQAPEAACRETLTATAMRLRGCDDSESWSRSVMMGVRESWDESCSRRSG